MTEFFHSGPHRRLRVLDLSDRLSGAFAARLFADFGAQVLLAEPRQGHVLRHEGPHVAEISSIHAYANWNKSSIAYEQLEDLYATIAEADVIVICQPKLVTELKPQLKGNAVKVRRGRNPVDMTIILVLTRIPQGLSSLKVASG